MAARSIAGGTVSFGLVSIPVKLFSTVESEHSISFNLLHERCGTRVKQQYVCPKEENEVVPRDALVKGYEFAKGKYVAFGKDELKALEEQGSGAIEIAEFIPHDEVDAIYYDKPYYLGPDKGGEKAYALLAAAMEQTGRVALGRYAARGKQYLVMLRPMRGSPRGLMLQQLRYADELKPFSEVPVGGESIGEAELALAVQLIEQIANDTFAPDAYQDGVRQRLREAIAKKIAGEEVRIASEESSAAPIVDLMEALKASLGIKDGDAPKAPKRVTKAPRRKKAQSS